jgi:hypothetical protein
VSSLAVEKTRAFPFRANPVLCLFGVKVTATPLIETLKKRISWLGERDRLGRSGQRLADRFFAVLYNSYRSNQGQRERYEDLGHFRTRKD